MKIFWNSHTPFQNSMWAELFRWGLRYWKCISIWNLVTGSVCKITPVSNLISDANLEENKFKEKIPIFSLWSALHFLFLNFPFFFFLSEFDFPHSVRFNHFLLKKVKTLVFYVNIFMDFTTISRLFHLCRVGKKRESRDLLAFIFHMHGQGLNT